jgi:hypothetical protein
MKRSISLGRLGNLVIAAAIALLAPAALPLQAQDGTGRGQAATQDTSAHPGYRIDQPGTITFTVGMVIKGKIDKPQVMIFLPKEKPFYREFKLTHSFAGELEEPLPFEPLLE